MLKIFNRDYEQTYVEIMQEFPNCFFLATVSTTSYDSGRLIGISEEPETLDQLSAYRDTFSDSINFCMGGNYKENVRVDLQFAKEFDCSG